MTKKKKSAVQPRRHDLVAAVTVAAILSVAVSVGQMFQGQAGSNPEQGNEGPASARSSSRQSSWYSSYCPASYCRSSESSGYEGSRSSTQMLYNSSVRSSQQSSTTNATAPASSVAASPARESAASSDATSEGTVIDFPTVPPSGNGDNSGGTDNSGRGSGDDEDSVYERERERQQHRGDRGCFDGAGNWVTDRTLCASADRQAGFIDVRQEPDAPPQIDVEQPAPAGEAAFYEEMHLRFRGEELQAQQDELAATMTAAIEHLESARAGITDEVAAGRLGDIASRIDALRVSLAGRILAPAEREWAEQELRNLLDESLGVIRSAWNGDMVAPDDDRPELDAILREFTFLIDGAPAVFELTEQYGVDVPDASYIAYVRLKALLEQAGAECANARCPLLPQMIDILENELQKPLLQSMEQTMEPQEVSALIERIEQLMTDRRSGF